MKRIDTIYDFADGTNLVSPGNSRLWTGSVISLALLLCVGLAFCQERKPITPGTAPLIVKLEPANGATGVDADAVKELRVTFDCDMNQGGFSWVGSGERFPKITGEAKWVDKRTCVLPVNLEARKTYTLGINSRTARNFKSENGVPVELVIYTFATGGLN